MLLTLSYILNIDSSFASVTSMPRYSCGDRHTNSVLSSENSSDQHGRLVTTAHQHPCEFINVKSARAILVEHLHERRTASESVGHRQLHGKPRRLRLTSKASFGVKSLLGSKPRLFPVTGSTANSASCAATPRSIERRTSYTCSIRFACP